MVCVERGRIKIVIKIIKVKVIIEVMRKVIVKK